jgi:hypothetical protein
MTRPLEFVLGGGERERLEVQLLGRERPDAFGVDDGNWIMARVDLAVGGFRGQFSCCLRAEDFAAFLPQLRLLEANLTGPAQFSTMEDQLGFEIRGDGRGHLDVRGHVLDQAGVGNRLAWSLAIDQTYLPQVIQAITRISTEYPVRGRRMSN